MAEEELVTFPADDRADEIESHDFNEIGSIETEEFQILDNDIEWDQSSEVTNALDLCRKYILTPYNGFLKVIGWRKFGSKRDPIPCHIRTFNILYPTFIFLMLLFACVSQLTTCFSRTRSHPPTPIPNSIYSILQCNNHTVTGDILLYLCLLFAYWGALYIFRFSESEHLSALSETVFVSFSSVRNGAKTWTTFVLIGFLVSGIVWFIFSGSVNILRLFALGLHKDTTIIEWFTKNVSAENQIDYLVISPSSYKAMHYLFISCSLIGFIFFDFLYIGVVINYCLQCQLLIFYVRNVKEKILNKKYKTLQDACKELFRVYEFLRVLNGKMAYTMSLILFLCAYNVIESYRNLTTTTSDQEGNIILGFLNVTQWLLALAFPIILATRFTSISKSLRSLGLQISSRPFIYSGTPDLELQFFLNFTSATNYQARLAFIPMYPSLVLGVVFALILLLSLGIGIPHVMSLKWF